MRKENIYLLVVLLVVLCGGLIFYGIGLSTIKKNKKSKTESLIYCILEKGVKLYISSECSFCLEQKEIFGDSFHKLDYVDCNDNGDWAEECKKAGINSVPSWVFPKNLQKVKTAIKSCLDCKKENNNLECENYCYTESNDGFLKISGILDAETLDEILECDN